MVPDSWLVQLGLESVGSRKEFLVLRSKSEIVRQSRNLEGTPQMNPPNRSGTFLLYGGHHFDCRPSTLFRSVLGANWSGAPNKLLAISSTVLVPSRKDFSVGVGRSNRCVRNEGQRAVETWHYLRRIGIKGIIFENGRDSCKGIRQMSKIC